MNDDIMEEELCDKGNDLLDELVTSLITSWKNRPSGIEHCCLANYWERVCAQVWENHFGEYSSDCSLSEIETRANEFSGSDVTPFELKLWQEIKREVKALSPSDALLISYFLHKEDMNKDIVTAILEKVDDAAFADIRDDVSSTLERYVNGDDFLPLLAECGDNGERAVDFLKRLFECEEIWQDEDFRELIVSVYKEKKAD